MSATFSKRAGDWYVAICYETDLDFSIPPQVSCGIDVGISSLLTGATSNNTVFKCDNP